MDKQYSNGRRIPSIMSDEEPEYPRRNASTKIQPSSTIRDKMSQLGEMIVETKNDLDELVQRLSPIIDYGVDCSENEQVKEQPPTCEMEAQLMELFARVYDTRRTIQLALKTIRL